MVCELCCILCRNFGSVCVSGVLAVEWFVGFCVTALFALGWFGLG